MPLLGANGLGRRAPGGAGKRWASGRVQKVKGGEGLLAKVNSGWEPTGRLVFGKAFKVVLRDTLESEGRAQFGIYFRVCIKKLFVDLGCTPYFIGPVPWLPAKETGLVILAGRDAPKLNPPRSYAKEISDYAREAQANYGPPEASTGVEPSDDPPPEGCTEELIAAVPGNMRAEAAQHLPAIVSAAREAGLSASQTAYVLATAQHESLFGKYMHEIGRGQGKAYGAWYGRGFVQLTWQYNYTYWSQRLGVDLTGNRDLAARPDLAAEILVQGMKDGTFTAMTPEGNFLPRNATPLHRFINGSQTDFVGARRIINGTDRAELIAGYARTYDRILKTCQEGRP